MVPGPLGSRLNEMWVLSHRLIRWVDFLSLAKLFLKKCRVIFICLHSSNTSLRYTYIFYPPLKVGENGRAYNYKKRKERNEREKENNDNQKITFSGYFCLTFHSPVLPFTYAILANSLPFVMRRTSNHFLIIAFYLFICSDYSLPWSIFSDISFPFDPWSFPFTGTSNQMRRERRDMGGEEGGGDTWRKGNDNDVDFFS